MASIRAVSGVLMALGLLLSACMDDYGQAPAWLDKTVEALTPAGPPPAQPVDMSFAALADGEPSIVHVDDQGHATATPIDFLKGQKVLDWDVANLDNIVTCEKGPNKDEFVLKYYRNRVLAKTFKLSQTPQILWIKLLTEKNCLFVQRGANGSSETVRIDLGTGEQKAAIFSAQGTERWPPIISQKPFWDQASRKLIMVASADGPQFLGRLDPNNLALERAAKIDGVIIQDSFFYNPSSDSVMCYVVPLPSSLLSSGSAKYCEVSLNTGHLKTVANPSPFPEPPPNQHYPPSTQTGNAILATQYIIMTSEPKAGYDSAPTWRFDLKTGDIVALSDAPTHHDGDLAKIPYLTSPISQDDLQIH